MADGVRDWPLLPTLENEIWDVALGGVRSRIYGLDGETGGCRVGSLGMAFLLVMPGQIEGVGDEMGTVGEPRSGVG